MTRAEKEARVKELDKQIREYPYWGAFLTAADEERRGLKRSLAVDDDLCTGCGHYPGHHHPSWHPQRVQACDGDAGECLCTEYLAPRCDPRDCDPACPGPIVDPTFKAIAIGGIAGALCLIALCIYKVATLS